MDYTLLPFLFAFLKVVNNKRTLAKLHKLDIMQKHPDLFSITSSNNNNHFFLSLPVTTIQEAGGIFFWLLPSTTSKGVFKLVFHER